MKTVSRTIAGFTLIWAGYCAADYSSHPQIEEFITEMNARHAFAERDLRDLFAQVEKKEAILEAIARPAEKTLTWAEYQDIFIQDTRIQGGAEFWQENREDLQRAYETYGVAPEIIVAVLGVETRYGRHAGSYRVIDALSTLGFDYPPRASFFRKELEHFLLLSREQEQNPLDLSGSYAGAMGYGQFMPSSYRAYAVDFDGDDFVDIWENPSDAIGSIANYLGRHGWRKDEAVVSRARVVDDYNPEVITRGLKLDHSVAGLRSAGLAPVDDLANDERAMAFKLEGKKGSEFWIGLKNFEVITRYNRSQMYAMAVYQLSEEIRQARERLLSER